MDKVKLEPGMKVIIRRDIRDGDFGIQNASEYRGREMTIRDVRGPYITLADDLHDWSWNSGQFETFYYPDDCGDPHVDSSFDTMLSEF